MNKEQFEALRKPFEPQQVGKLPKPTKKENPKGKCAECGGWHGLPAVHLDYVGHAAITDRLLHVDPEWTWEPLAVNEQGFPLVDQRGGLWIKLTVCGVTRPGYGDETNGKGMKEVIGDALRNAAMRFGVGLDLWSKEDLGEVDENGSKSAAGDSALLGAGGSASAPSAAAQTGAGVKSLLPPSAPARDGADSDPAVAPSPKPSPDAAGGGSQFQPPVDVLGLKESRADNVPPVDGGNPALVPVHFGKNAGSTLGSLSQRQIKWYAESWEPNPEYAATEGGKKDRRLKAAAVALLSGKTLEPEAPTDPDADLPF